MGNGGEDSTWQEYKQMANLKAWGGVIHEKLPESANVLLETIDDDIRRRKWEAIEVKMRRRRADCNPEHRKFLNRAELLVKMIYNRTSHEIDPNDGGPIRFDIDRNYYRDTGRTESYLADHRVGGISRVGCYRSKLQGGGARFAFMKRQYLVGETGRGAPEIVDSVIERFAKFGKGIIIV